jgi:Mannosyl-glycoprotein endo-beta-N-acetylglucosaminidase
MAVLRRFVAITLSIGFLPSPASAADSGIGRAVVRSTVGLNVRSGPFLSDRVLARLANRKAVSIACRVRGQDIVGSARTTTTWVRLTGGGYSSDAFLSWTTWRDAVPTCSSSPIAQLVNVRTRPTTAAPVVGLVDGPIHPTCRVWSQYIEGNPVWYQIGVRRFVTSAYVRWPDGEPRPPWCGASPPATPASNEAFLASTVGPAQASARKWRVPASVTIAQAILESGWGRSPLAVNEHNLFGMKCFGGPGPIAVGCTVYATRECSAHGCYATRDAFRAYRRVRDSFEDHGQALARLPFYTTAMKYAASPDRFAVELQRAGYATAPTYAANLTGIMRNFNLYHYDPPLSPRS